MSQYVNEKNIKGNYEYIKQNYKEIHPKFKNYKEKNKHFKHVFETQCFKGDTSPIWVAKLSNSAEYLAVGSKSGVLTILEFLTEKNILSSLKTNGLTHALSIFNENPYKVYNAHQTDIIDLDWSPKNPKLIVTVSIDHNAILYDVTQTSPLRVYPHNGIVSCVSFAPLDSKIEGDAFITGCFDKIIRVWSTTNNSAPISYVNVTELVTAIAFFPLGDFVVVGNNSGKCSVYSYESKLVYSFSFNCRNKNGKYKHGRKITNIYFINCSDAVITTNDSRIRMINISTGNVIHKYKGLVNDDTIIRSSYDELSDSVISASDDGNVFIWKNNRMNFDKNNLKNYMYESIKPFSTGEKPLCSMFLCEKNLEELVERIKIVFPEVLGISCIINCGDKGSLQVLLNCEQMIQ